MTITTAERYDYPPNQMYNETVAYLSDGRVCTVDTQYAVVLPHGEHADDCDQLNKMGGRCSCGLLDGIDVEALVADARARGKCGRAPRPAKAPESKPAKEWRSERGLTLTEEMDREDTLY